MKYIPYTPPYDRIPYGFCAADDEEYEMEENMDFPVGNWIKIDGENTLPDDGLCLVTYRSSFTGKLVVADCFATCSGGKWYWWVDGYGDEVEFKITHWMIPSTPDE